MKRGVLGIKGAWGSTAVGFGEGLAGGALSEWSRIGEVGTNGVRTETGLAAVADGERERVREREKILIFPPDTSTESF